MVHNATRVGSHDNRDVLSAFVSKRLSLPLSAHGAPMASRTLSAGCLFNCTLVIKQQVACDRLLAGERGLQVDDKRCTHLGRALLARTDRARTCSC